MTIAEYPKFSDVTLDQRPMLDPRFRDLPEGISELAFANIYLFRRTHQYRVAQLEGNLVVIAGRNAEPFFILPFGLPQRETLDELFDRHGAAKCCPPSQAEQLAGMGYRVWEDRDNFDYLYGRQDMASLPGRKLHRKKNLVNLFLRNNACTAKPLLIEYASDALRILETWKQQHETPGDYVAAREALEEMEQLQLCGGTLRLPGWPLLRWLLPVFFTLYRKRTDGDRDHPFRTRQQLAGQMIQQAAEALPKVRWRVVADGQYASRDVVRALPENVNLVRRIRRDAAIYALPKARRPGQRGQPAKKGPRLPTPRQLAARRKVGWEKVTLYKQVAPWNGWCWGSPVCGITSVATSRCASCWFGTRRVGKRTTSSSAPAWPYRTPRLCSGTTTAGAWRRRFKRPSNAWVSRPPRGGAAGR